MNFPLADSPQKEVGKNFFFFKTFSFTLERAHASEGGRSRERKSPSRLSTGHRAQDGADPTTHKILTWAENKSWLLNRLSHQGTAVGETSSKNLLGQHEAKSQEIGTTHRFLAKAREGFCVSRKNSHTVWWLRVWPLEPWIMVLLLIIRWL